MPPRGSSELDRFYLQLLADFSGQILVRSMSRIAGLAVTAILMSCAINPYSGRVVDIRGGPIANAYLRKRGPLLNFASLEQ
jgi:hypothetical protein